MSLRCGNRGTNRPESARAGRSLMTAVNAPRSVSHFTFGRRKICEPHLAKMRDENASHRIDRLRRPGRAWPALVGCRDVQIGPHAQRGNQLGLNAVRQSVAECLSPSANRMKAQSINLSVICSIRPPPPASQARPTGRGAQAAEVRRAVFCSWRRRSPLMRPGGKRTPRDTFPL